MIDRLKGAWLDYKWAYVTVGMIVGFGLAALIALVYGLHFSALMAGSTETDEIFTAVGTVGAAVAAAISASISRRSMRDNQLVMLENERSAVIRRAYDLAHDCNEATILFSERSRHRQLGSEMYPSNHSEDQRKALNSLNDQITKAGALICQGDLLADEAGRASSLTEMSDVRNRLTKAESSLRAIRNSFSIMDQECVRLGVLVRRRPEQPA